jgi:hypothetical protein
MQNNQHQNLSVSYVSNALNVIPCAFCPHRPDPVVNLVNEVEKPVATGTVP